MNKEGYAYKISLGIKNYWYISGNEDYNRHDKFLNYDGTWVTTCNHLSIPMQGYFLTRDEMIRAAIRATINLKIMDTARE